MSTMSLHVTVRPRRVRWSAIMGGGATVVVIGLLTAGLFFPTATSPKADVSVNQPVAASAPPPFEIVPAFLTETNPQFFFGTGDNSAGFYAERPTQ